MANTILQTATRTTAQAANALTGNGTAVDVTNAKHVLIAVQKSTGTAGIFTFERSTDDGQNYSAMTVTRASDGAAISATSAAESGETYIVTRVDGDTQIRVRISTDWVTSSPAVTVIVLN